MRRGGSPPNIPPIQTFSSHWPGNAGWPDVRPAYLENLRKAEEWVAYCAKLVEHLELGRIGTGCDPVSRQRALEEPRPSSKITEKL